jgi:hypothetical protein
VTDTEREMATGTSVTWDETANPSAVAVAPSLMMLPALSPTWVGVTVSVHCLLNPGFSVLNVVQPLPSDTTAGLPAAVSVAAVTATFGIEPTPLLVSATVAVKGAAAQRQPARHTQSSGWLTVMLIPLKRGGVKPGWLCGNAL